MPLATERESPGRPTHYNPISRIRPPMNHAGYVPPEDDDLAPTQAPAASRQPPVEESPAAARNLEP
jgi:hypothetical protein